MDNNTIYIVPLEDKPVKLIYKELLCPIGIQLGTTIRCKYAKSKIEDINYTIYCSAKKCELNLLK